MEADHDYLLARLISFVGGGFRSRAGFFGQQACEKYMKALNVQRNGTYLETHRLLELAQKCEPDGDLFSEAETKRILAQFDTFDQVGRYGAAAKFDPHSKGAPFDLGGGLAVKFGGAGVQVAGAWAWSPHLLHDLDGFVFRARSLLDFKKINWGDGLLSVLADDKSAPLCALWELPIPIRDVLIKKNAYFKVAAATPDGAEPG